MAREDFARHLPVAATPEQAWYVVTDIARLVRWISVLEEADAIEEMDRYRAVLADRLGMFSMRADLDIRVHEHERPKSLRASAEGEDRQVGSRITVDLTMALDELDGKTQLRIEGSYEVTGRVATMGSSTIRRKADKIVAEFFDNLEEELG
jgi:uncharacterized protein